MRSFLFSVIPLLYLAFAGATPAIAQESLLEGTSGLPIPRFVSLRFEEVNVRTGPGTRYPIRWVYKKRGLPVEVVEEFGQWRKIRDQFGDDGWVHQSQTAGTRNVMLKEDTTLQRYPEKTAPPLVRANKGVMGRVLECSMDWCHVQIDSYKAWSPKTGLWGVYPAEVIED